jgi:hypothetical protein
MPVYLHPYRSELIDQLKNIAAVKIKTNTGLEQHADNGDQSPNSSSAAASNPETSFSIWVDLMPLCKRSTDLSNFDLLEEMITGETREIVISLHYTKSNRADKYIIRMQGVDRAVQFANEKDLSGFSGTVDIEKIKTETAEQVRKAFLAEQQQLENEKLRLELERLKSEPPSEDSLQLNKLIMTAGMAAIKKWETGSLFPSEKPAAQSPKEESADQKNLITIGRWFCKCFPKEEDFNIMFNLVELLSKRPDSIPLVYDLACDSYQQTDDQQQEQEESNETNNADTAVIDLTDQTPLTL